MTDDILINIGCGSKNYPGFINVDAVGAPHIDVRTDNLTILPFDNNHADLVYMCHVLEHVKREEVPKVFREMYRILKKDGIFRVSVPGFDELVGFYNKSDRNIHSIELQLMGGQNHDYNFHYSVFNEASFIEFFIDAGFREVRKWNPENCKWHDFKDRASREISLNIEGVK